MGLKELLAGTGILPAAVVLMLALTIAIGSVGAALLLGRGTAEDKASTAEKSKAKAAKKANKSKSLDQSKAKEAPAADTSETNTTASFAKGPPTAVTGTPTTAHTAKADARETKPVKSAKPSETLSTSAASSSTATAAKPTEPRVQLPQGTVYLPERLRETGSELWLVRILAVRRVVDSILEVGCSKDEQAAASLRKLIWACLDDRPKLLSTGCGDGQGRTFDVESGKLLVTVRHDFSSRQPLTSVLLMQPGPQLLTTTWDGKWHTWEDFPSKPLRAGEFARGEKGIGHENSICAVVVAEKGDVIACGCTAGCVLVFRGNCPTIEVEVTTSEEMENLRDMLKVGDNSELYLENPIELGGVSLERKMALLKEASFSEGSSRRDLPKLELPARLHFRFVGCYTQGTKRAWRKLEHGEAVRGLALDCEGRDDYIYSASRDRTLRKWALRDGSQTLEFKGHTASTRCVAVNRKHLASGSDDRAIKIWNKATGECRRTLTGHGDFVRSLAFCKTFEDRLASSADDLKVFLWDASSGERLCEYPHPGGVVLGLSLRDQWLFTVSEDKYLRLWCTESAACQRQTKHPAAVTALSVL